MWNATEIPLSIAMYNPNIEQYCQQAYLADAEPREKRIEELEQKLEQTKTFLKEFCTYRMYDCDATRKDYEMFEELKEQAEKFLKEGE